ncbi:putative Mitochondrial glycoprotein family protein [Tripterygium wilfordii]|uniref:Putative Mitochondrial glycoprotein family protein n=1 Tax=Tripterygium wilfordii TaxID=458696 RepID=A0A7J7D851_TRIWF|nr:putative Mitochondrial glycoprotein family protein [Tripterygium wilfordii]
MVKFSARVLTASVLLSVTCPETFSAGEVSDWKRRKNENVEESACRKHSAPAMAHDSMSALNLQYFLLRRRFNIAPKVSPPSPFTIMKGALDSSGPVLKRTYGNEEISISVMRLANIIPDGGDDDGDDGINQLFLHVDVSKPDQNVSVHFLCGLYPDALGIHSVSMRSKLEMSESLTISKYNGPVFE